MFEIPADGDYDAEQAARAELLGIHLTGSRTPLYLIRSWEEIEHERSLARVLGPEQPIVSVGLPHGKAVEDFPADAHAWADFALARLQKLPGPFRRLAGWSMGGILAYEVAQRLARKGEPIELVVVLDTFVPVPRPSRHRERIHRGSFHRAVRKLDHFLEERTWPKRRAYLRARWERRRDKLAKQTEGLRTWWRGAAPDDDRPKRGLDPSDGMFVTDTGERITLLQRTIWVSYRKYRPGPCDFPLVVLRTAKTHAQCGDASLGWGAFAQGDFQSVLVPGKHFTMWNEPHVQVVAGKLGEALRTAACVDARRDDAPDIRRSAG
ncbi:MAG TPA: alpha/beta fold hydrolase [Myxococcota bacterium]|nr:alpha/beta fold hydrolase [Myxococcota bacterium]